MRDMQPFPELTDAKLAELSSSDLDRAKARVVDAETLLTAAKAKHFRTFPPGASNTQQRQSLSAVQQLVFQLSDAEQRLRRVENQRREIELLAAQDETGARQTFEVAAPDGRKIEREAVSLESLKKQLAAGYEPVAEISALV